jgi:EcsC protein family
MSEEVVRMILDGKLTRKWRLAGERGYMSVFVDVEEVRALVRGPDHGGFTAFALKDRMQTCAYRKSSPSMASLARKRTSNSVSRLKAWLIGPPLSSRCLILSRSAMADGAPILLKFVTQVAARFGLVVTQKVAAQALPLVGALGGGAVNYAFIEHFQDVARGHFTVRRLERLYGKERIRSEYDLIAGHL